MNDEPFSRDRQPGWYPDRSGRHELRYWDGTMWTDHVADQGTTSVEVLDWDDEMPPYERRQRGRDIEAYSDAERVARTFGPVTMPLAGLKMRNVVGEQYHQAELDAVTGGTRGEQGVWIEKVAELRPEPSNPHDPNAVMVLIEGQHVGYLPAKSVKQSRRLIDETIDAHVRATCLAVINKGWSDDDGVKGAYGVRLYYGTLTARR